MAMRRSLKDAYYTTLRSNLPYLCREIDALELTDILFAKCILSREDLEEVEAHPSQRSRTRALIFKLMDATDNDYDKFILIVKEIYPHVASTLQEFTSTLPEEEENNSDRAPVGELEQIPLASGASVKESEVQAFSIVAAGLVLGMFWLVWLHYEFPTAQVFLMGLCTGYVISAIVFSSPFGVPGAEKEQLPCARGTAVKRSEGVPDAEKEQLSPARGTSVKKSKGAPVGELEQLSLACGASVKESEAKPRNHGHSVGHPQSLMPEKAIEFHNFEHEEPIVDVAFLRCGIVIADIKENLSLYTEEGRRLHQIKTDDWWCSLALLSEPLVALVKRDRRELQVLHATRQGFEIKVTEKLQKQYSRIAAVDKKNLAAAVLQMPEIDLLDLSGVVLKTIQTSDPAYSLCVNSYGILIASLWKTKNHLTKIHLDQGTEVLLQKDPKIPEGRGVSALPGGCFVIGDRQRKTLCLMTEDGQWIRDLASLKDKIRGYLIFVSVCGEKVVCASYNPQEIFVLSFV